MAIFSWDGRAEIIFILLDVLLGENGKIMDIQSKTEEFCSMLIRTFRVIGFEVGAGRKPETHTFFFLA